MPHSEIPGSKLILSSPGLIAEYHVLHRLLLPRHSPNALLALDLIQKETDSIYVLPLRYLRTMNAPPYPVEHCRSRSIREAGTTLDPCFRTRKHTIPDPLLCITATRAFACDDPDPTDPWLVYLTWTTLFVSAAIHVSERGNTRFTCRLFSCATARSAT